jgi:hypothetical protein
MKVTDALLVMILLSSISCSVQSQSLTREQAGRLMDQCRQEREDKIAPLKAQAIEDCVARGMDTRDTCERKNRNFGERSNVGAVTGLFWDLPVCQQALDAEQYFKRNPGADSYTPG